MEDKTVLITGGSSGIGKETAKALAYKGVRVVIACRNNDRGLKVYNEIKTKNNKALVDIMHIDLSSIGSIKKFSKEFINKYNRLDVLINNAGVFCEKREETEDGFEKTMGVNYFGLVLLTHLLIPVIKSTKDSRIINLTSKAGFHGNIDLDNMNFNKGYQSFKAYSSSKLAVILYTIKLSEILKDSGVTVNAAHPGSVYTNMWKGNSITMKIMGKIMKIFSTNPVEGAKTSIYLATSDKLKDISGKLFHNSEIMEYKGKSQDKNLKDELWVYTKKALNLDKM